MSVVADIIMADVAANRPAASSSNDGYLYYETDTGLLKRSNGSTWVTLADSAATNYTDEKAQDAVGAMIADTDTLDLTYTDATPELKADVKKQMSITSDASGLKLSGDSASPGNNKVYGTDGSGVKGWKADPAGGGGGALVQKIGTETGAVATGTTTTPIDDTIPQNTEGTEFATLAITPTDANNILYIDVVMHLSPSTAAWIIVALHQDSVADAIAASMQFIATTAGGPICFRHKMIAGTTSPTTFKVRAGMHTAGTLTFNGIVGARSLGGVLASSITIEEVTP